MSKVNKRGTAAILLLASIVKRSIDKTMGKSVREIEDPAELDKAICSEVITTLNKKDDE